METLIIIPARIDSTRLPRKMLADINGKPLILRTYESALAAGVGKVVVACDCDEIADVIRKVGGEVVLTDPDLQSGTDRVFSAWTQYDPEKNYQFIINVQGDQPFIAPDFIQAAAEIIKKTDCDISTLATPIKDDSYKKDSVVKPVIAFSPENCGRALYFSRSAIPFGGPYFHHVGIYCFRADGLRRFVNLPQSPLEKSERLEQLRALENGLTIAIQVLEQDPPISIDTPEDLDLAEKFCRAGCY